MMSSHPLKTGKEGCYDITPAVRDVIKKSGVDGGVCIVYCPHTTAGITINENADPDVVKDLLYGLDKAFPDSIDFRHSEGNSAAHLKASCIGSPVHLRHCLRMFRPSSSHWEMTSMPSRSNITWRSVG